MSKKKKNQPKKVHRNKYEGMGQGKNEQNRRSRRGGKSDASESEFVQPAPEVPAEDKKPKRKTTPPRPPVVHSERSTPAVEPKVVETPKVAQPVKPKIIVPPTPKIIKPPAVHTARPSGNAAVFAAESFEDLFD